MGFLGTQLGQGWGGSVGILPEPRWIGLCPQTAVGLSRVVPTVPSQAGRGSRSTRGAQGPIRPAGRAPGHPSAWRGGAAPGTSAAPADGSTTPAAPVMIVRPPEPAPTYLWGTASPSRRCPRASPGPALSLPEADRCLPLRSRLSSLGPGGNTLFGSAGGSEARDEARSPPPPDVRPRLP